MAQKKLRFVRQGPSVYEVWRGDDVLGFVSREGDRRKMWGFQCANRSASALRYTTRSKAVSGLVAVHRAVSRAQGEG